MAVGAVSLLILFREHWYGYMGVGAMALVAVWLWLRPEPPAAEST